MCDNHMSLLLSSGLQEKALGHSTARLLAIAQGLPMNLFDCQCVLLSSPFIDHFDHSNFEDYALRRSRAPLVAATYFSMPFSPCAKTLAVPSIICTLG